MKDNKNGFTKILKNNWFIFKLACREAPFYTIFTSFDQALHEIIVFFEHIFMIAYIIDCIQYKRPFINALVFVVCIFVGVSLVFTIREYKYTFVNEKSKEKIYRAIRMELYKKASRIDLECYDNPEFYNEFVWSMSEATSRIDKTLSSIANLIGAVTGTLVTGIYVITSDKTGLIFAIPALVLTLFFNSKANKSQFALDNLIKPLQRKRDYFNRIFYLSEYAKEIRLSEVKKKLFKEYEAVSSELKETIKKNSRMLAVYQFILDFICNDLIFEGLYLLYLLYKTIVIKAFSYGTMVALYSSLQKLKGCMQRFTKFVQEMQQNSLYIEKIRSFLNYEEKLKNSGSIVPASDTGGTLELKNVSFSYNKDGGNILSDINLTINPGEKVAFVGYNGAGKTSLVKLLMRLYDPNAGEILYNGINIKDYDIKEYRSLFGTAFQDYQLFAATLGQNIMMDYSGIDEAAAIKALDESEFNGKLSQLGNGLDTSITTEFDEHGVNLSGGEAQKVAISRVLYKNSPVIILDEPSSALDPISEYKINDTIKNISNRKTVIFISHRLSTTRMADKIYMFENGRIIEQGNHMQLIALNGKYADMFNLQAEKYR